jgi:hypothetical protein
VFRVVGDTEEEWDLKIFGLLGIFGKVESMGTSTRGIEKLFLVTARFS